MKSQILFSGKNEKNITSLSSAEFAQRVVKVKSSFCTWNVTFFPLVLLKNVMSSAAYFDAFRVTNHKENNKNNKNNNNKHNNNNKQTNAKQ